MVSPHSVSHQEEKVTLLPGVSKTAYVPYTRKDGKKMSSLLFLYLILLMVFLYIWLAEYIVRIYKSDLATQTHTDTYVYIMDWMLVFPPKCIWCPLTSSVGEFGDGAFRR